MDNIPIDEKALQADPPQLGPGLRRIRRRRWYLWLVLIIYLPTMWITQEITQSFNGSLPVFFIWCLVLVVVMSFCAVARCPRCGNYFHVNGMSLLLLRRCLHCQLHLNADKKGEQASPENSADGEG